MVIPRTYGRMGNYLFQVAAVIAYSGRNSVPYTVPTSTKDAANNPIYLQHLASPHWDPKLPEVRVVERGHGYQKIPFQESWRGKNIVLDGYWQSEKYFSDYRSSILDRFGYYWSSKPGVISVHVRRGDYLRLAHKHPPISKAWYEEAMKKFPGKTFMFFSDDIDWCRIQFGDRSDCFFSGNHNEESDLVDISCCEHHISSASTFSWWGAWLNQNPDKRVIIPQRWFSESEEKKHPTMDIVPDSWERQ